MITDLTDLVDNHERPWTSSSSSGADLTDNMAKANIARHLATLCNEGGGYLVFGFRDDTSTGLYPSAIAGII